VRTLATWSLRHRRIVIAGWLLVLLALTGASRAAGTNYSNSFTLPNTESTRAAQLLQAAAPTQAGATASIVIGLRGHTAVTDPAVRSRVQAMLAKVARLPHVTSVASPYSLRGRAQVSKDATVAFAVVTYDRQAQALTSTDAKALVKAAT
jgi:putative drug exporter of the RND superfamily